MIAPPTLQPFHHGGHTVIGNCCRVDQFWTSSRMALQGGQNQVRYELNNFSIRNNKNVVIVWSIRFLFIGWIYSDPKVARCCYIRARKCDTVATATAGKSARMARRRARITWNSKCKAPRWDIFLSISYTFSSECVVPCFRPTTGQTGNGNFNTQPIRNDPSDRWLCLLLKRTILNIWKLSLFVCDT